MHDEHLWIYELLHTLDTMQRIYETLGSGVAVHITACYHEYSWALTSFCPNQFVPACILLHDLKRRP